MAETAFTWPTFSAINTTTTGIVEITIPVWKTGEWNCGKPIHAAFAIVSEVPGAKLPVSDAKTHPTTTPKRIPSRAIIPRPATVKSRMAARVTPATNVCFCTLDVAAGARFKPMRATIAPVTGGGITAPRACCPTAITTSPRTASANPAASTPPSWAESPALCAAVKGAMNANEDPKYDGRRFLVMRRNAIVPRPENNKVVLTGNPVRVGTRSVAPNMAMTCCIPTPIVRGQLNRSSGATTAPGRGVFPSPCTDHGKRLFFALTLSYYST